MTTDGKPESRLRRSPLYRWHCQHGAVFEQVDGHCVAASYGATDEPAIASRLGLCDLSLLPRSGVKGRGSRLWLETALDTLPESPNRAVSTNGLLVASLSRQEFLLLGDLDYAAAPIASLERRCRLERPAAAYLVPRSDSHGLFALCGASAPQTMAKLCGVDLRPNSFPCSAIAQTSIARVDGIVIRQDLGATLCYYLLADSTCTDYLWMALIDAMHEYTGAAVGVSALRQLSGLIEG